MAALIIQGKVFHTLSYTLQSKRFLYNTHFQLSDNSILCGTILFCTEFCPLCLIMVVYRQIRQNSFLGCLTLRQKIGWYEIGRVEKHPTYKGTLICLVKTWVALSQENLRKVQPNENHEAHRRIVFKSFFLLRYF